MLHVGGLVMQVQPIPAGVSATGARTGTATAVVGRSRDGAMIAPVRGRRLAEGREEVGPVW